MRLTLPAGFLRVAVGSAAVVGCAALAVHGIQRWRRRRFRRVRGMADVAALYDGFVLDAYGVIRDAKRALPGAVACLERLRASGKKLAVVSNSTSLDQPQQLEALGVDSSFFSAVVTSGSAALPRIRGGEFGRKAVLFCWTPQQSRSDPEALGVVPCAAEDADFVLATGTSVVRTAPSHGSGSAAGDLDTIGIHLGNEWPAEADEVLAACLRRRLKMVVLNPDVVSVQPDGSIKYQAGAVGKRYERLGGEVEYIGKPRAYVFREAIRAMGLAPDRVAHVGDSLHHDVAGAKATGIDSVFIASGIHKGALGISLESRAADLRDGDLEALFGREGETPTHVSPHFRWLCE